MTEDRSSENVILEARKKELDGETLPAEISELLELSDQTPDEHLIPRPKTRDIFDKNGSQKKP